MTSHGEDTTEMSRLVSAAAFGALALAFAAAACSADKHGGGASSVGGGPPVTPDGTPNVPEDTCAVRLYTQPNYQGASACLGPGAHALTDLRAAGVGTDAVQSVRVATGFEARLFEADNLQDRLLIRTADDPSLAASGFARKLSSVRVDALPYRLVPRCPQQVVPPPGKLVHPGGQVSPEELSELWSDDVMATPVRANALEQLRADVNKLLEGAPRAKAQLADGDPWLLADDGKAVFGLALLFEATCDPSYADKAAPIIDAWASKLQGLPPPKPGLPSQGPLYSAWGAIPMVTGVELLSRTYKGWDQTVTARFRTMIDTVIVPQLATRRPPAKGSCWMNNWHTAVNQAWLLIGILEDDPTKVAEAAADFRRAIEGREVSCPDKQSAAAGTPRDVTASDAYLAHGDTLVDAAERGATTEDCRDPWHSQVGLHALVGTAEAAWHQGIDLYGHENTLVKDAVEYHARLSNNGKVKITNYQPNGYCFLGGAGADCASKPELWVPFKQVCAYPATLSDGKKVSWYANPGSYELAFRHYGKRLGLPMPDTEQMLRGKRPQAANGAWGWDTVTHSK